MNQQSLTGQVAIQNVLRQKFQESQRLNPRYSLRAFSKKVGVHVGALSGILNGKRKVSRKLAERITQRLLLDPQLASEVLSQFPNNKKGLITQEIYNPRYLELSSSQFKISTEWEYFAVMSLVRCDDFESSPKWIAQRLGISEKRAEEIVNRLLDLELFKKDETGTLTRTEQSFRTPDEVADISLKKHHDQTLELARESIYRDAIELRDFTTITMAIDPSKLRMAKELIRKQQDELSDLLEAGKRTEVYRLSIQLIPLTKAKG
jgi:uncharacterized protein (TIGR02147 family)